jgi:hypothetical protein
MVPVLYQLKDDNLRSEPLLFSESRMMDIIFPYDGRKSIFIEGVAPVLPRLKSNAERGQDMTGDREEWCGFRGLS